jgi:hypothetical protein
MIWLEPGDLREILSWNYERTSSIKYCFFLFFGCFWWSAFENLDLVQNWLGSSSLISNVTLRGGFFFGTIDHVVSCTLNLYTSKQLDLEIWKSATFSKFFCFCLGLSWHKFQEKFPTSNKLTLWRIAHSNSTNAALLAVTCLGEVLMVRFPFSAYTWPYKWCEYTWTNYGAHEITISDSEIWN